MTTETETAADNIHEVPAERLEMGTWCHTRDRQIGEGDIYRAYSADTIALEGRIRRPFQFQGSLFATTSVHGGEDFKAEAYRLQLPELFNEQTMTYAERCRSNDPRSNPNGFYHGMLVRHGKQEYVLVGPPQQFCPSKEPVQTQGSLF
ncbi:hypothetical protein [Thalassoglobus sp.]|uniref:hypothetical protein n=1 Tax=Thalassoglobus sp. TaxID=2795869 RepID=UPI003AA839EF